MKHRRCAVVGRWRDAHTWNFSCQQTSVVCSQRVSESVYAARITSLFSAKMIEWLEQRYCIKFCQKLGNSQVETIQKIQRIFGDDAMGIIQIKEWYNQFKDGHMWVDSDAHSSRLRHAGPSCHRPRTCEGGGDKHWFDTFHFDRWFGHAQSVRKTWQLHHDNAPAHFSQLIQTFLAKQHSCGSTGSLLSRHGSLRFWLFPHPKTQLKGTRFESWDDIIQNTTDKLYSIRKEAFQKCFKQWQNCWEKCVQSQEDYFEGDYGCRPPGV